MRRILLVAVAVGLLFGPYAGWAQETSEAPSEPTAAAAAAPGEAPGEEAKTEADLPTAADENVTVTLRETGVGRILPDEYVAAMDWKKTDPNQPVQANEGWKFFWSRVSLDRLDVECVNSIPTIQLIDSAGSSYETNLSWRGIKVLNPQDLTSVSMAEGDGYVVRVIPEAATPERITFSYSTAAPAPEETGKAKKRRRRARPQVTTHTVELVIPG